jgi:Cu(I)/Ag(I) efflux system membrane protein CusA/SilA
MLRSENARLSGWVYVDVRGRDLRSAVNDMQAAVNQAVKMPAGYAVSWSGQFEYLERATERLKLVVPGTLAVIFVLLYLLFRSLGDAALVMAAVPFSLIGGFWLVWVLGHAISVATAVGFIALAGLAAEFGVVMLVYLKNALARRLAAGEPMNDETLLAAIREGALQRVRPKAMTVAVVMAGLLPILLGSGTGSEVMTRIAAPMVGGMVTAPLLSMLVVPAAWYLMHRQNRSKRTRLSTDPVPSSQGVNP